MLGHFSRFLAFFKISFSSLQHPTVHALQGGIAVLGELTYESSHMTPIYF